eukprot:6179538-Pleurochrysis_carterae.AAC.3
MSNASRAESNIKRAQMEGLHVTYQLIWSRTAIGAAIWPRRLPAKQRSATLAGAAILAAVRMAKLFGTRAPAILNKVGYHYHIKLVN